MAEPAEFEKQRERLWGIAYRITGSVADADDALQDAWLRWRRLPDDRAENPAGYLTAVVSRICYDQLTSARARREAYIGPWLPEPVVTEAGPEERATLDDSVGTALLTVLERLTPAERTALVLHDAFAVPFAEIADVVGRTPESVRQLASRARRRVRAEAPRRTVDRAEHRRTVDAFLAAAVDGDLAGLARILDPEVVWRTDGDGLVGAARVPVVGREKVTHFIGHALRAFVPGRTRMGRFDVNDAPGLVVTGIATGVAADSSAAVYAFTVRGGLITRIDCTLNPAKLAHLDLAALHGPR